MGARGLIVAAPRSGAGKTTLTLALVGALRRRGVRVRVAKSGPDYIDGAFHTAASGAPCPNLDSWAMAPEQLDAILARLRGNADLVLIETAMGLFDGVEAPPGRSGAGAEFARRYGLPVLLLLDVSGQSQTAAAVAHGLASFDREVRVGGLVLNRVGSARHRDGIAQATLRRGLPVLGSLPRQAEIALPERHLGLVQAEEQAGLGVLLERLAELGETALDLDRIMRLAMPLPDMADDAGPALRPPGQRVALARDAAFSFVYPHVLEGWREAGAEIVPFSPLADEAPPEGADACWLPGGYPELHAGRLAAAARFRAGLCAFAGPVHGVCGGFMVLGTALEDAGGTTHPMLGLLGHVTSFARRKLHLGYREARLLRAGPLGPVGAAVRGHEFHYAAVVEPGGDAPLAALTDATGRDLGPGGGVRGRVSGTFFHAVASAA